MSKGDEHFTVCEFDPDNMIKGLGPGKNFNSEAEVDSYIDSTGKSKDMFAVLTLQRITYGVVKDKQLYYDSKGYRDEKWAQLLLQTLKADSVVKIYLDNEWQSTSYTLVDSSVGRVNK